MLVADDDRVNRKILASILKTRFDVVEAGNGRAAVEVALSEVPEVVLLDIQMPGLNGYEATRAIKSACGSRHLPILLMTASNSNDAFAEGLDAGADDFITKPISRLLLESKVGAALRAVDMFRQLSQQNQELARFRDRARNDLAVARRVFDCLLQRGCLSLPSLRFVATPMETFNGDMVMAAPVPPDRLRLFVGDFAGHGLSAAVGTMPVSDIFYATAARGVPLEEVLREMNSRLRTILPRHLFLSAFMSELNLSTGRLLAWNAGLPEAFVLTPQGAIRERIVTRRTPLGVRKTELLDTKLDCFTLARGERLLAYTDGVIETASPTGDLFGADRLEAAISEARGSFATEHLGARLSDFRSQAALRDDVTFIELSNDQLLQTSVMELLSSANPSSPRDACTLRMTLDASALRDPGLTESVRGTVDNFMGKTAECEGLLIVVHELLMNALDHGVLRIPSATKDEADGFRKYYANRVAALSSLTTGFVRITLQILDDERRRTRVRIEDSGQGYCPEGNTRDDAPGKGDRPQHGRGLQLVRSLSESMDVVEGGRAVEAVVHINSKGRNRPDFEV